MAHATLNPPARPSSPRRVPARALARSRSPFRSAGGADFLAAPDAAGGGSGGTQAPTPPAPAAGAPSPAPSPSRATGRVLVVEDDLVSARALRGILRHAGWEVDLAASITEAMRLLANGPNWVILDLMLPDGDGEAVLRHLRNTASTARVTVTTGIHDPARLADLQRLQPDAVLQKPIDPAALLRTA